ncbi:MAG TPA: hypothetical protein VF288_10830 [Mycobacteriales bacterium]
MSFVPAAFTSPIVTPGTQAGTAVRSASYISPSQYRFAPTAVGTQALVAGSTDQAADSLASLARVIARASAWIDEHCFHRSDGTLAASVSTEWDWARVKPDGSVALVCNFAPVIAVTGVGVGPNPSGAQDIDQATANDISVHGKVIELPGSWAQGSTRGFFGNWPSVNGSVYAVWSYVNGWPHATLADACAAGATSLSLTPAVAGTASVDGIFAGTALTIHDRASTETVVAASPPSGGSLALSSPTLYAHTPPGAPDSVTVSAIPPAVEQACVLLTSFLVKTQGTRAMDLPRLGSASTSQKERFARAGALDDFDTAARLLKPYVTVYLH